MSEIVKDEAKYTKYNFVSSDKPIESANALENRLKGYRMVPDSVSVLGEPGKTGLAIVYNGTIHGSVKHPNFNPVSIDYSTGRAEFGKVQDYSQIETSMGVPIGKENAQLVSAYVIRHVKEEGLSSVTEETGFGTMGPEEEALHYNKDGSIFELPAEDQIEVQVNVKETPINPPSKDIWTQARLYAEHRRNEQEKRSDGLIVNTSFSILGKPQDQQINNGNYKPYVHAVTAKMFKENFFPKDPLVQQYWDKIAQNAGMEDFYDLREKIGNLAPLTFTASHVSLGLRSERRDGGYKVGLEEAVAVADLINSDFSTLLEWMTYSTPIAFENKVGVEVNGVTKYPKDARAVARLASKTTYPGDFIYTPKNYRNRVAEAIVNGYSDRMDRAGYITTDPDTGEKIGSAHGRVRLRVTGGSGKEPFDKRLGRVEFTGGGSTPDLTALIARNAMVLLLGVAAYESTSKGNHPAEYFRDKFPSMSTCNNHVELVHAYNFDGAENPKAANLIQEGYSFLNYVRENYKHPEMQYLANLAEVGLTKLEQPAEAQNLDEYLQNPQGSISEVISKMYDNGMKPLDIAKEIQKFEKKQAEKILEYDGDVLAMHMSALNNHKK